LRVDALDIFAHESLNFVKWLDKAFISANLFHPEV